MYNVICHVKRMQAIYILTGVDAGDNAMLVDASRKRQLHKDAVDVPSGVQLLNQIDQIFFASILVKYVLLAVKAAFTTILDFSGHIGFGCQVVPDHDNRQTGNVEKAVCPFTNVRLYPLGESGSIHDNRAHS